MMRRWPSLLAFARFVQPATIMRWHRAGFRTYWCWNGYAATREAAMTAFAKSWIGRSARVIAFENPAEVETGNAKCLSSPNSSSDHKLVGFGDGGDCMKGSDLADGCSRARPHERFEPP